MVSRAVIDTRLSGLIDRFYEAAVDDAPWMGVAADIADVLASTSAVLKLHGGDGDDVQLLEHTDNFNLADDRQSWARHWHQQDLWVARSAAFGVSQVVTDHDLVTPSEQRKTGFYREWLHALDIFHMVGAVFPGRDGALGVLGVHRPACAGAYADSDRHRLATLLPHLQRALWLSQKLTKNALRGAVADETFQRIDAAVFAVDARCRIIVANTRADALLRVRDSGLAGGHGRLRLADPLLNQRMQQQVQACIRTAQGQADALGSVMAIPRPGRLPLTMMVSPLRPAALFSAGNAVRNRPLALVMIRDPEASALALDGLRRLFGLTRMEAAVAADLAGGLSPGAVAARRGIGAATVRAHLKAILAKTGTHRQAEAVALIARSVAGLDADGDSSS